MISGCGRGRLGARRIIALFSLVFPRLKLGCFTWPPMAASARSEHPGWFQALSNWSMLDVVLVALVIFAAKTSGLATAFTRPGLWFFAASAMLTRRIAGEFRRIETGAPAAPVA